MAVSTSENLAGGVGAGPLQHKDLDPWLKVPQAQFGASYTRSNQGPRAPFGFERYIQRYIFDSPAFGQKNSLTLPQFPMQVDDMWVEMLMTAAATGPTTPRFEPTPTWIDSADGISLDYKGNRVVNLVEPAAVADHYMMTEHNELIQHLVATNDQSTTQRQTNNTNNVPYNISMRPVVSQIMAFAPPIGSFDPNSWRVNVNLRSLASVGGGATTTAFAATISAMRLVVIGHKMSPEAIQTQANKLVEGLGWHFLDWFTRRESISASATSLTVSFTELQGNAADVAIMHRITAGLNSTTPSTKDNLNWQALDNQSDTLEVGTTGNDVEVYGVAIQDRQLRNWMQRQYPTGWTFVDAEGSNRAVQITMLPFTEGISMDYTRGAQSGTFPMKSKFRIKHNYATTVAASTVDFVIRIHKYASISNQNFVKNNSV